MDAENAPQLRLFGLPSLSHGGVLLRFPSKKGLALLLLLAEGQPHSRDKLAGWLWADSENPRDALRNCLAQVNKVLSGAGLPPLEANRQQVRLNLPELWTDAAQLELEQNNLSKLEAVVGGLEGAWLEGFGLEDSPEFETWAAERGAFYTGLLQQALERLIEAKLMAGKLDEALAFAQQRLRLDVLNEAAYQSLMRVQRSAGREAEARETLLLCQTTLQRELGIAPSAKTLGVLNEPVQVLPSQSDETLIGREEEQGWLEQLRHSKGFGLLEGEAGEGKSALLRLGLASALWLECRPNDAALPFSSLLRGIRKRLRDPHDLPGWARLELSKLAPELHHTADPSEPLDKLRLYSALGLLFPSSSALVVDDLHFIDGESAAWLWQTAQARLDESAAPTVLAYRPNDLAPEFKNALARLSKQGAQICRVAPLELSHLAAWLGRLGLPQNLAAEFLQLTAGNALFFKEAVTAFAASGSFGRGLLPLLQGRLESLSELEWQLTQFVAVAGTEASLTLAAQVLNVDALRLAETWARLERLEVLRGNRLAHDLLLDAALELIPPTLQTALSLALLDALEIRLRRGESVGIAVLAEVAARAADARREAHYRIQAALEAYALGLIRIAIDHMERCVALLVLQPNLLSLAELETLYLKLTPLYRADLYNSPQIKPVTEQLLGLARQRGSVLFEGIMLALQADLTAVVDKDVDKARVLFGQALEFAEHTRTDYALCFGLDLFSWFQNNRGQVWAALESASRGLALANRLGDASLEYRLLEAVYMFEQNLGLWRQAQVHALQAATIALQTQVRIGRPYALTMAAFCALNLGDLPTALRHARSALELLAGSDWHNALGFAQRTLALILLEQDDLSQALELALESVEQNRSINNNFGSCSSLAVVARIHLAAGRPKRVLQAVAEAQQALAKVRSVSIVEVMQSYLDNLVCSAQIQLSQPALPSALRAIESRRNPPENASWLLLNAREDELELLWKDGRTEQVEGELEAFLKLHPDNPRVQLLHDRARARVLRLQGDEKAARGLLEAAQAKAVELGLVLQARQLAEQLVVYL